ncbi:metal-binding protein [Candidatus Magnetoovum chiemensis]|nr:metal-binding protein [Candidatus Magnetoovum chiemensis]
MNDKRQRSFNHPLVFRKKVTLDHPSQEDKKADCERLIDALHLDKPVEIPLSVLQELPSALRKNGFAVDVSIGVTYSSYRVISLQPRKIYGIAVDIGSTNITASFIDLEVNLVIKHETILNPQLEYGHDVLTRMFKAMSETDHRLHKELIHGINSLIDTLIKSAGKDNNDVLALVVAGNTVMTHFFLNLSVNNIPVAPYVPVVHDAGFISPSDIGININRNGSIYIFPNIGSYVGGDIVSGILYTGIYKNSVPNLLIDIGTNAEIAVGTKDWIIAGAGAAGPAFDEGISQAGKIAAQGAIYRTSIKHDTREVIIKTIGNTKPIGFCGSGLVSLMAELYRAGMINSKGALSNKETDAVIDTASGRAFKVHENDDGAILLYQSEIENFMRTKAAAFSLLYVIVDSVGISFSDIDKIHITGGLGAAIYPEDYKTLGFMPHFKNDSILVVDNASLRGAEKLITNSRLLNDVEQITRLIIYKEMNEDKDFMREFVSANFIPHTNPQILKIQ